MESPYLQASKSRDNTVAELNELRYNNNAELSEMNHRCEASEHELSLEHAKSRNLIQINRGLEQHCRDPEELRNYKMLVPIEMRHCHG